MPESHENVSVSAAILFGSICLRSQTGLACVAEVYINIVSLFIGKEWTNKLRSSAHAAEVYITSWAFSLVKSEPIWLHPWGALHLWQKCVFCFCSEHHLHPGIWHWCDGLGCTALVVCQCLADARADSKHSVLYEWTVLVSEWFQAMIVLRGRKECLYCSALLLHCEPFHW